MGRKLVNGELDYIEAPLPDDDGMDDGIDYSKLKAHNCEFVGEPDGLQNRRRLNRS